MQCDNVVLERAQPWEEKQWCAIHTRYQHEYLVNEVLQNKGFETFFPAFTAIHAWKDRKKEVQEALFPGYLFVNDVGDRRLKVVTTPGVCSIVCASGMPAIIPSQEIESIRLAVASPYTVESCACLQQGDKIRVQRGPLMGAEGILVRKGKSTRLIISVEMLGRAAAVEINSADVEPITPRAWPEMFSGTRTIEKQVESR
jgi:transcriptional antiterminator NusG